MENGHPMTPFNTLTSWCRHGTMRSLCFLSKLWQKQKKITSNVAVRFENSWWKEKKNKVFKFLNLTRGMLVGCSVVKWRVSLKSGLMDLLRIYRSDVWRQAEFYMQEVGKILILSCLERSMSSSQSRVTLTYWPHDVAMTHREHFVHWIWI